MKIVITGAAGFVAKNLMAQLSYSKLSEAHVVHTIDRTSSEQTIKECLSGADVVFHLAGVNRPKSQKEFETENVEFTKRVVEELESNNRPYRLIFSSSSQAELDNDYGRSKLAAEEHLKKNVQNGEAFIYRLPGIFGKWCRPNYNSVVATFCHNVAHGLPLQINDPDHIIKIVYIDDLVRAFISQLDGIVKKGKVQCPEVRPEHHISLGKLAEIIETFPSNRKTLFIPDVGSALEKALYSTWLTYLPTTDFSYCPELRTDNRGTLFELLKTGHSGQIFISSTLPGITRGNHFHHTKTEKFVVIHGKGLIQFRSVLGTDIIEYEVNGETPSVVDIPPGYTHNIKNVGDEVMVTLFWANEIFDPQKPDTYYLNV